MNVTDEQLMAYRAGRLDPISDAALEELLMIDSGLRQRLALLAPPARLDAVLAGVNHTIDQPTPHLMERVARRLGVPEPATRLAGATPTLTRSWIWAIVGLALASLILSSDTTQGDRRLLSYLLIAPVLVIVAVAGAYGRSEDPAHEITIATPMSGSRLLFWRVVAIAPTAIIVNLVVGALLRAGRYSAAWLIPGVACAMVTLAFSASVSIRRAATIVALGYVGLVGLVAAIATDSLAAFRPPGQLLAALVAGVATVVLVARRDRLEEAVRW